MKLREAKVLQPFDTKQGNYSQATREQNDKNHSIALDDTIRGLNGWPPSIITMVND